MSYTELSYKSKGGNNIKKNYKVYKHTNKTNQKCYIGITHVEVNQRWNNGIGYKDNDKFFKDIQKYGWNNFNHEILKENLTYKEAVEYEEYMIKKLNTVENGYNKSYSGLGCVLSKFNFYDFDPIQNPNYDTTTSNAYFTRVPNILIRTNIQKTFGVNRILLPIYITIDRNRSIEDYSYITVGSILDSLGYKVTRHKPKLFYEIIKCLLFLHESNMISISIDDIYRVDYNDCIKIKIIKENFDYTENFTKLYGYQYDSILNIETKILKENLLMAFLYINSYIGCRSSKTTNPQNKPEAFFKSIETMAKELCMSKDTITQCINRLTTSENNREPLLIKKEVGSVIVKNKPQNVPNIYVLNEDGYEQEIEWALSKMCEIYNVKSFNKISGNY